MSNPETANTTPVTPAQAAAELNRRRHPKGSAERRKYVCDAATQMGGVELKAIVPDWTPAAKPAKAAKVKPAKPAKPARTEIQILHTRLRAEAYAWKCAEYHAGRKCTLAAAYAKFKTAPAGITNAPDFAGI